MPEIPKLEQSLVGENDLYTEFESDATHVHGQKPKDYNWPWVRKKIRHAY